MASGTGLNAEPIIHCVFKLLACRLADIVGASHFQGQRRRFALRPGPALSVGIVVLQRKTQDHQLGDCLSEDSVAVLFRVFVQGDRGEVSPGEDRLDKFGEHILGTKLNEDASSSGIKVLDLFPEAY